MTARPDHARLAPSSAHRWGPGGCPASPAMEQRYPEDTESEAAREGTAAHWVALDMILRVGTTSALGTLAPNGFPVTQEMLDGCQALLTDIRDTLASATPGLVVRIEERVDAHDTIHPDNDGTPDAFLVDRPRRCVHIWDYKFGHRPHDPYRHWQLVNYAAAILESEGIAYGGVGDWAFTFTIAQPRSYHPDGPLREWITTGTEVIGLINQLRTAAYAASAPDALCSTGPHCRDCRAEWDCVANQRMGGACIDVSHAQQTTGMDAASLGLEARMVATAMERLAARKTSLDERILGLIRGGQSVPHWSLGWTKPLWRWKAGMRAAAAGIGDMFGVELRKPDLGGIVTPAEAVKLGIDETVITEYAERPSGSAKLVAADDSAAARVYGNR